MADNKIYLQKTNKSNPANPLYGDLIYSKDGTLKTVNESNVPVTLAKKSELNAEVQTIENKLAKKADLDENGLVPASQLPSYVDDVLEYPNKSDFPRPGEEHKVYVDTSTNMTYRWSGSDYVIVGNDLALGETAATAYAGNKGKQNADNIAAIFDGSKIVGDSNKLGGLERTAFLTKQEYTDLDKDEVFVGEFEPTSNLIKIWYPIFEAGEEEENYEGSLVITKNNLVEEVQTQVTKEIAVVNDIDYENALAFDTEEII